MFSRKERDYLLQKLKITKSYERVLKHRIRVKLDEFYKVEHPLLEKSGITKFHNGITENHNENQRARPDSNRRPNAPQALALSPHS